MDDERWRDGYDDWKTTELPDDYELRVVDEVICSECQALVEWVDSRWQHVNGDDGHEVEHVEEAHS